MFDAVSPKAGTMEDDQMDATVKMGVFGSHQRRSLLTAADVIALVLSLIWLGATTLFFFVVEMGNGTPFDPLTFVVTFMAIALPIAMFWLGASAAKSAKVIREESDRIQATIDAMRHSYIEQQQVQASAGLPPALEKRLTEIAQMAARAQVAAETAASRSSNIDYIEPPDEEAEQPELGLQVPDEHVLPTLTIEDFISAVNFPENTDDAQGFRALRTALSDHRTSGLIRSAQDLLTLLSEDGIYMDDLRPDRTKPELWRRFAEGERGPALAALGAVRDRSVLALTGGRMRQDHVFRDTAHHFLRRFDTALTEFEKIASDEDLVKLSDTRTARAFMLLGRVTGTFD